MSRKLVTPEDGANAERAATKRKLHAAYTQATTIREYHNIMEAFLDTRTKRYNKRRGGLGKQ